MPPRGTVTGTLERGEDRGGTCVCGSRGASPRSLSDLEMEDVVQRPELKAVPELRAAGEVALGDGCVRELYEIGFERGEGVEIDRDVARGAAAVDGHVLGPASEMEKLEAQGEHADAVARHRGRSGAGRSGAGEGAAGEGAAGQGARACNRARVERARSVARTEREITHDEPFRLLRRGDIRLTSFRIPPPPRISPPLVPLVALTVPCAGRSTDTRGRGAVWRSLPPFGR